MSSDLEEALKRELHRAYDEVTFGEGALRAIRTVVPSERQGKLSGLDAFHLGSDLCCHIRVFNGEVLRAAGLYCVHSDEYGHVWNSARPRQGVHLELPPAGLKTILKPEDMSGYLVQRLILLGALPVPTTPIEQIINDLGWEAEDTHAQEQAKSGSGALDEVVGDIVEEIPGLRVMIPGEFEMLLSGEGKVDDCVHLTLRYATQHLDELEDLIREIWHAGNICFNDFLVDEERAGRAALFVQVRRDLMEHGDSHPISMSMRSEAFRKKVLPQLLSIRNRRIGEA